MKIAGYCTTEEAAEELGVTARRVQQLLGGSDISTVIVGRAILIPEGELDKLKDREQKRGRKPQTTASPKPREGAKKS